MSVEATTGTAIIAYYTTLINLRNANRIIPAPICDHVWRYAPAGSPRGIAGSQCRASVEWLRRFCASHTKLLSVFHLSEI